MAKRYRRQPPLDRYTPLHVGVGVAYGLARLPWWAAAGLAVGWELAENRLKDAAPALFPDAKHDRPENAAADAIAVMVGWAAARALKGR